MSVCTFCADKFVLGAVGKAPTAGVATGALAKPVDTGGVHAGGAEPQAVALGAVLGAPTGAAVGTSGMARGAIAVT